MVADLLEAHQKGQDHAASLNAVERIDGRPHLFDRSRVQGGLASTQQAVGVDLSFVGQIGDDTLVGLEPSQDLRLH